MVFFPTFRFFPEFFRFLSDFPDFPIFFLRGWAVFEHLQVEDAKQKGLVDPWFDFWVNESETMNEEAHCYMLQCHFKRVCREEQQPDIRMSMLEDSHTSHKTKRVALLCKI